MTGGNNMRCNFGCCRGFFGIGIGRVPENLSCMMRSSNHNHNCCCDCRCEHRDDCDDYGRSDCCEYGNNNRSC